MISKTKYKIENKEIEKIFRAAGIGGITGISPLGEIGRASCRERV